MRTTKQINALAKAREALADKSQQDRDSRKIPDGYSNLDALLAAVDRRCTEHPRGLAGVAAECRVPRRSLQRWLDGTKFPAQDSMQRLARVVALEMPTPLRSSILRGEKLPPRSRRMLSGKWHVILADWRIGDAVDVAVTEAPSLMAAAKLRGQITTSRRQNNRIIRVWRTK